ncbi:queuosine precursor transporter [Patescibacteria group bacterium]|nr:queuosine precursor transporter [Patescibacteria group bacterium]
MPFLLLIFWILGITSITLLGSWYARRYARPDLLIALYVTFILVAQILAVKISLFDLGFAKFFAPAGVLVFSITYLLTDIVNEKFGRAETHRMIFIAFVSQVAMVFFFWLGVKFPAAPFWRMQDAWQNIFGLVPRITSASWVAFLASENFDAYVFDWFKKLTRGKHLWSRNVFSSIPALLLDSLIFVPLAFFGAGLPLLPLITGQVVVKWLVGFLNIPFMYLNEWILFVKQDDK